MEGDELREAAIEITASSLRSNHKPESGITPSQLSKFQELHRRRLNIKAKSKAIKKTKGFDDRNTKIEETEAVTKNCRNEESSSSSRQKVEAEGHSLTTWKRQKLHWGLDTKERWEMKANM